MKRFFGEPMTLWPSLRNRLHVYLLPDAELRTALSQRQRALDPFEYCAAQPAEFLHATVQQFAVSTEQVNPEQLDALRLRLAELATRIKPFEVPLAAPVADEWSLGVRGEITPQWQELVEGVRSAAAQTVNAGIELPRPPFGPHLTLGYGVAEGSSEQIQAAADALNDRPIPPLRAKEMHLLAVHQDVARGSFSWDSSEVFGLG